MVEGSVRSSTKNSSGEKGKFIIVLKKKSCICCDSDCLLEFDLNLLKKSHSKYQKKNSPYGISPSSRT